MSKQDSHTGALYCKISGELYMMPYTAKDVQDLRNTLTFNQDLQRNLYAEIKRNKDHISGIESQLELINELTEAQRHTISEQAKEVEELQTEITDIQWKQAKEKEGVK